MNQLEMFADPVPVVVGHAQARKNDPETSKLAAEEIESSGKAESHRQMVLDAITLHELKYPHGVGPTFGELAEVIGLDRVEVMRRLNDLAKDGKVIKAAARKCAIAGTSCSTWLLVN